MQAEIRQLLELQSMDLKLTELHFQVKRHTAHCHSVEQKIADEEAEFDRLKEAHAELEHESRMRNLDVDELDANIRTYQKRLDEGIISFKEMEDLRAKIKSDRTRIETMEDEALALMDQIETSKIAIKEAKAELATRVAHLQAQIEEINAQQGKTQEEIGRVEDERRGAAEAMPSYLLSQYETLRAEFSDPLATIHHGTCSGCKLKLSGSTVERVRGGMGLVSCEHCNRLLYVE